MNNNHDLREFRLDMFATQDTTIICIDLQEKLVNMLDNPEFIVKNCEKLLRASSILNVDTILTEQYPKGLGSTIETIKAITNFEIIEKTSFSAYEVLSKLNKNILIFGIETHICVLQSVVDLINSNHNVYVLKDCCASRNELNYETSLELMKQLGAKIITTEIALFNFLKSSKHPNFKEIQSLIK